MTFTVSGSAATDPALLDELREALAGRVEPAPVLGSLHDVWRLAVDWGPHAAVWVAGTALPVLHGAKPTLEVIKLALDIVDKLLALGRRRPSLSIKVPSRDGPIEVTGATRQDVADLIAARLAAGAPAASEGTGDA